MPAKKKASARGGSRKPKARPRATPPPRRRSPFREPPIEEPAYGRTAFTQSPMTPGFAPECMACPFGLFLFAVRQARPEVSEHLVRAGHEIFLAVKAFTDQAGERVEASKRLEHIPVR